MKMNKFPPNKQIEYNRKGLSKNLLINLLKTMIQIREFESEIAHLVDDKKIITPCHLYIGQEAVATGVCHALQKDDYVFGTHRSHGHYIAKGGSIPSAMAEIFGRSTGCSGGRGGSMHLCALEVGILGTSSIVSGCVPLGIGAALAELIKGTEKISVIFHGDGVLEEGAWNESMNFAAINSLPVLFVCENNLYCTHLSLYERRVKDNLLELAAAHGIPGRMIDGNNVLDIFHSIKEIVDLIRKGSGPRFVECRTYRWLGHVGSKDNIEVGLRSQEEIDAWKKYCPIKNFINYLIDGNIVSEEEVNILSTAVKKEINDAVTYALNSPFPQDKDLMRHVYIER